MEVGLNQELVLECDAIGSPQPAIEWVKHANPNDKSNNSNGELWIFSMYLYRVVNIIRLSIDLFIGFLT